MRFLSVSSNGFGFLRSNSLTFAPKFTVVYGPNETGKSTWHTALYAAFCGMRRSRIQSWADEEFIQKYRPWNSPNPWEVSVRFLLQDGRNIELRQELADRIDCRATDVDFDRDYSNEIVNEGGLDGSVWLGLDRRSFLATAWIKQGQLLDVIGSAEVLQTHLQRAIATCAANSPGAKALQLIESFRAEHVGDDRANTRPLYRVIRRVESLKSSMDAAKAEHLRYLQLMASETQEESRLELLRRELNLARAIVADRDANDWERRLLRVNAILNAFPERPSRDLDRLHRLVREASAALKIWEERPDIPDLSGPTAAEIEDQIRRLPPLPSGDLESDPQVLEAEAEYLASRDALTLHTQAEPPQAEFPETGGLSSDVIRQIASFLEEAGPAVDPRLEEIARNPINERSIHRVHTAIEVWERRPKLAEISSPTAAEIRRVIDTLPIRVEGDLEASPEILEVASAYSSAKEAIRQHAMNRPADAVLPDIGNASPAELRTLALRLRERPVEQPALFGFISKIRVRSAARMELEELGRSRQIWIIGASVVSLAITAALAVLQDDPVAIGVSVAVFAALVCLVAKWKTRPILAKRRELESLKAEVATESRWQKDVLERLKKLRLPADSDALDAMAFEYENAQDAERMLHFWKETAKRFERTLETATAKLQSLLSDKISGSTENVEEALAEYQHACTERYQLAALAGRKQDLEMQLAAKIEAEASAATINQQRKSAEAELRVAAGICGVTAENDAEIVNRLQEWLKECERQKLSREELGHQALVRLAWNERQLEQRELLRKSNLPFDAAALRRIAESLDQAHLAKAAYEQWSTTLSRLAKDCERLTDHLRSLLQTKQVEMSEHLEDALERYREACESRAKIAGEGSRRQDLEPQLATRRQMEAAAGKIRLQRENARQELVTVAEHCGVPLAPEDQLAQDLHHWRNATTEEIRVEQQGLEKWRELDTLLEGLTLQEFQAKVQQHRENALLLSSPFSSAELSEARSNIEQYEAQIPELAAHADWGAQEVAYVPGQIRSYAEHPVSVSDAEEELRIAEEKLANIRMLDDTLETTHLFLSQAHDSVHRDIAPFLAEVVRHWLPEITLGRYVDARVDSQTLEVQVCYTSGEWRDATRLSHGTADQIYLLLRLAMVEYLTKPSEVCPLILDDITLQSDTRRKERLLNMLRKVSEQRQVILFTQEEEVLQWAKKNLSQPEARMLELMRVAYAIAPSLRG